MSKPLPKKAKPTNIWKDRPHQTEAIKACIKQFKKHDRGQCIMACGTGKTIVGIRVHEELDSGLTLVLVPSLSLLSQTLRRWRDRLPDLPMLAVCSDATVGAHAAADDDDEETEEDEDDITAQQVSDETGVQPTTNAVTVATWLRTTKRGVVFCTYQSSPVIAAAQKADKRFPKDKPVPAFDLTIADEAHRCAGRLNQGPFGTIVRPDSVRSRKRLFMTATPRIFRATTTEGTQDTVEVASMDNEQRFGPRFYYLSFGEAILRGLLADYQVLISLVSSADVAEYIKDHRTVQIGGIAFDAQELALHVAVYKAVREHRLTKTITFHSRIFAARNFSQRHPLAVQLTTGKAPKKRWINHMSAKFSSEERLRIIEEFATQAADVSAILTNAQCLTEGIDVAAVDSIVFADPRESVVAITQAIGRAIRKSPGKTVGTIVIPVFVPDQETVNLDVLEGTDFSTVRKVLAALKSNDERLGDVLSKLSVRGISSTTSTDSGEVAPAFVTAADFKKGLKAGKMIEAGEDTVVHEVKAGRPYDAQGREIVVPLPERILVSTPGKGRAVQVGDQFAAAICNRVVNSTTPKGGPSANDQANAIADFTAKHKRMPDPKNPKEAPIAKLVPKVRCAGARRGLRKQ